MYFISTDISGTYLNNWHIKMLVDFSQFDIQFLNRAFDLFGGVASDDPEDIHSSEQPDVSHQLVNFLRHLHLGP